MMEFDICVLYKKYYKDIYKYIYVMTLNSYDTEDILQNVFLKAMKGIKTFRGDSTVKTWIFTIARNECLNYIAKNKREIQLDAVEIPIITDDIEEKMLQKESVDLVLQYIQSREEPIKSLLILRLIEEKSFTQIGKIINKSDVWCRVNFFRTKKELIDLLEDDLKMEDE